MNLEKELTVKEQTATEFTTFMQKMRKKNKYQFIGGNKGRKN